MRQLQGQCQARAAQGSGGTRIPLEAPGFPWRQEKAEDFPKNPTVMICLCLLSHWTAQVMLLTSPVSIAKKKN